MTEHLSAVGLRRIPTPRQNMDVGEIFTCPREDAFQFIQRPEQVPLNIVVQSSQWRHIDNLGTSRQPLSGDQLIEGPEKSSKSLSCPRGGRDQKMFPVCDPGPSLLLHICGLADSFFEPSGD